MSSNIQSIARLTSLQEGILFHHLSKPAVTAYHSQFACIFDDLDPEAFKLAWDKTIARHGALRTLFTWENRNNPLQLVRGSVSPRWKTEDWGEFSDAEIESRIAEYLQRDRETKFALDEAPLLRFALFRMPQGKWKFVLSFHHLILDGWSLRLVLSDVFSAYRDPTFFERNEAPPAFETFVQFLDDCPVDPAKRYWSDYLRGLDSPSLLCGGTISGDAGSDRLIMKLPQGLSEKLKESARANKLTLNTLVLGAWSIVLSQRALAEDVIFGTTMSGRSIDLTQIEEMVGLFINTLPTRIRIDRSAKILSWLGNIQREQLAAREYEQTPLVDVQRMSEFSGGTPLFDHIVVFENFPRPKDAESGLSPSNEEFFENSHYPFALLIVDEGEIELWGVFERANFEISDVSSLLEQLIAVLQQMSESLDATVGDLFSLLPSVAERIDKEFNNNWVDFGGFRPIPELILEQVRRNPEAVAAQDEEGQITYGELGDKAKNVAASLQSRGVSAEIPVGIMMNRSCDAVVAITGVLLAGGCYVPIDPNWPEERRLSVCKLLQQHAGNTLTVIVDAATELQLPNTELLKIDRLMATDPSTFDYMRPGPDKLAYIIFTSGSTGEPKGVMIEQGNLFNSTTARAKFYDSAPSSFLLLSPLATDSSVAGIFWSLCNGGTLVLPRYRAEQDPGSLCRFAALNKVSHILCLPSLYRSILAYGEPRQMTELACVIVAGESCPRQLISEHRAFFDDVKLYNEYGPSEACVWATAARLDDRMEISLGKPIANTHLQVVDGSDKQVPIGCPGELLIGGENLARGYFGRPDLTEERFINARYGSIGTTRYYRTGDLVRWRPDGELVFLGRSDSQVKIRGYRVELEEIERIALDFDGVSNCSVGVTASSEIPGAAEKLYCIFTSASLTETDPSSLKNYLAERLPHYMVPAIIQAVTEIPKTAAGKTDSKAIAELLSEHLESGTKPKTADNDSEISNIEQQLSDIWSEVLGLSEVGVHENFFELGGDSLLSIRIMSKIHQLGLSISPEDFFELPTISEQAAIMTAEDTLIDGTEETSGDFPLSPIQHWFLQNISPNPNHWNQSVRLKVQSSTTYNVFANAAITLWKHHDGLRSVLRKLDNGAWHLEISSAETPIRHLDFRHESSGEIEQKILRETNQIHRSFDLEKGPLVSFLYVSLPENIPNQVVIVAHHFIVDTISWGIILEDLATLTTDNTEASNDLIPTKTSALKYWHERLAEYANGDLIRENLKYWQQQAPADRIMLFNPGEETAENTEGNARLIVSKLSPQQTESLTTEFTTKYKTTVNEALISALVYALRKTCDIELVQFDVEGHGRENLFPNLSVARTIGWFTSVYPLFFDLPQAISAVDAVGHVKETIRSVPNSGIDFGIGSALRTKDALSTQLKALDTSTILFNYLGFFSSNEQPEHKQLTVIDNDFGEVRDPQNQRRYELELNTKIAEGQLTCNWRYVDSDLAREILPKLTEAFMATLLEFVQSAEIGEEDVAFSPSDFPLADIDESDLDNIAAMLAQSDEK